MRYNEDQPLAVVAAIHRHMVLFKETVLPWQTLSGLSWLLAGIFCGRGEIHIFSDWSFMALFVAMIAARCSGMCWNRLIDWHIDARNPRTAHRPLPSGRLSPKELAVYALVTLGLFLFTCFFFSPCGRWMGIGIALFILFYSFTKRFTSGCHFILGLIHGCLPLAGVLWQCGTVTLSSALLAVAAFSAVSGTDILYALQDELFDRRFGLYSIPAKFGTGKALEMASTLHAISFIAITFALFQAGIMPWGYAIWAVSMASLLGVWRSVWKNPSLKLANAFPILLTGFSVSTMMVLAIDKVWKALS
jgi:4-hydroxybenzoate polyprenyltransferase